MNTEAFINDVLFIPRHQDESWRRPTIYSFVCHAIAAMMMPLLYWEVAPIPAPPVRVVEINIMGQRDLALKGTGHDYSRGPLLDKTLMSSPSAGKKARGSPQSARVSPARSAESSPEAPAQKLQARGPLFRAAGPGGGINAPTGADRIYSTAGLVRTDTSSPEPGEAPVSAGSSHAKTRARTVRGLVASGPLFAAVTGGSGGSGDVLRVLGGGGGGGAGGGGSNAGRGGMRQDRSGGGTTGVEDSGEGGGSGNTLGGGLGSIDGGSRLERQGTAIIVDYPLTTGGLTKPTHAAMAVPQASGDFFAISGSLSRRRILKIRLPRYPRWAEEKGLETSVSVWLMASAQGVVGDNIYISQTSGYPELDRIVLEAVKNILFAPLPDEDSLREENGIATFNFKLNKNRGSTP